MKNRIRLGPLTIFFAVIAIILTMMALLTFATANADEALAERYAQTVKTKYELEMRGNEFLCKIDRNIAQGKDFFPDEQVAEDREGIYTYTEQLEGYTLSLDFKITDGKCQIIRRKISRSWGENDSVLNLWQPEGKR